MSDLADFQQRFGEALAAGSPPADPALARALAVHRNTSAKAAQDAIWDNYPVLRALVGDDAFRAFAAAFAGAHPPREPRLCFYGREADRFLSGYAPFAELPWLADVARLEWLVIEALFAADAPTLDAAMFAETIDLERPLPLHPAARFAAFDCPAAALWLAHQEGADEDDLDRLDWTPGAALVTRPLGTVRVTPLGLHAPRFLELCASARPLGEAAAAVPAAELSALFSTLVAAGAFAGPRNP